MGAIRLLDYVLALFFFAFTCLSFTLEASYCLGAKPAPDAPFPLIRESYHWGLKADMLWVVKPVWVHAATCLHAFFFAPFYFLFAVGLTFKMNWIRIPAIAVCVAKLYAGALYMIGNLMDPENSPAQPRLFVMQSLSYMMIPFLMTLRMIPSSPFGKQFQKKKHN